MFPLVFCLPSPLLKQSRAPSLQAVGGSLFSCLHLSSAERSLARSLARVVQPTRIFLLIEFFSRDFVSGFRSNEQPTKGSSSHPNNVTFRQITSLISERSGLAGSRIRERRVWQFFASNNSKQLGVACLFCKSAIFSHVRRTHQLVITPLLSPYPPYVVVEKKISRRV